MRVEDLDLRELLRFDPRGGPIFFGRERVVLMDAVALGLLRKELVDTVGPTAARCILTRLGYAHGWRAAESLERDFPWDSRREWQRAGSILHMLQGMVVVEPVPREPGDGPRPFAECLWRASYEADQHLLHLGRADDVVCWSLSGFASGYLSYCNGREIVCIETACRGRGDELCRLEGRPAEEWGPEIEPHRAFYRRDDLDGLLRRTVDNLRRAEQRLVERRRSLAGLPVQPPEGPGETIARGPAMRRVLELVERVAAVDATVLITGESGSGKERVARMIHDRSPRAGGPFVAVNCGAITETLLESELFGHARGSFTGATGDRAGLFESASEGTILLDEIGETTPAMQVKLLRVLQEREIRRVGESRTRRVDVRVLAATNRDLAAAATAGSFREDLLYRLRVVEVRVPPLRERREDVMELARLFLSRAAERLQKGVLGFTPAAADLLLGHDWPGNVRELENAVEHAVVLSREARIDVGDLPPELRVAVPRPRDAGEIRPLADVERDYLLAALEAHGGHRERTATALGIGAATLYRKLKTYGVDGGRTRAGGGDG